MFKAIERFSFICFKLGGFNTAYKNSEYYRYARSVYFGDLKLDEIINSLNARTDVDTEFALQNFISRTKKRFDNGDGYYTWNAIKYFLYEYEFALAEKYGITKITWELFSKTEKDKVSVEHILPQTPTRFYWKNTFRQFSNDEIKCLSGALGNLLPLRQSINSSLQNNGFDEKKHPQNSERCGYENGSHSEIEVSQIEKWDANEIYARTIKLLDFMKTRWNVEISDETKEQLSFISFVNDGRTVPAELNPDDIITEPATEATSLEARQKGFWTKFTDYCDAKGRHEDISFRKGLAQNWYDIPVGAKDYLLQFTITYNKYVTLLIYTYSTEAFDRLLSKKDSLERVFGDSLEWYTSRENSVEKRILYKMEADYFNESEQTIIFDKMIETFDRLKTALDNIGE